MSWNTDWFLLLNAPAAPGAAPLLIARLLAGLPPALAPALLVWLWVRRPDHRRAGLLAVLLGALFGQLANLALGALWFEPRPFMAGLGHTLLDHAADNGFPSDHATLMFALGSGLALTGAARGAGLAVCLLGLGVGWARVYLGVHFPIDVLAERLSTTRGALYKTLHDARRKLRTHLHECGLALDNCLEEN